MSRSDDSDRSAARQRVDETGDPIAADDETDPREEPTGPRTGASGREIVVPLRLYKTITVFTTLIAVVTFLFGFLLLDAATLQIGFVQTAIVALLDGVGLDPSQDALTAVLAIAGVGCIVLGTAVYVLGTRFRAQGMGKPQEDSTEG